MEYDCLNGWIFLKKLIAHANISSKVVNPRDIAGNAEEKEEDLLYDSLVGDQVRRWLVPETIFLLLNFCTSLSFHIMMNLQAFLESEPGICRGNEESRGNEN